MLSQIASQFPMIWLSCIALLMFFGLYLGILAWVHRKGSTEIYGRLALAPLTETETDCINPKN
jgi:hypothetical protein